MPPTASAARSNQHQEEVTFYSKYFVIYSISCVYLFVCDSIGTMTVLLVAVRDGVVSVCWTSEAVAVLRRRRRVGVIPYIELKLI